MSSEKSCNLPKTIMKSLADVYIARRPYLYRLVRRIVGPGEAEDILQEAFLQSYNAALSRKIVNPQAFMLVTARNLALNFIGRAERRLSSPLEEMFDAEVANLTRTIEESYISEEKFHVFCRAISRLPPACRRVFIYKKIYGLSQKEIAGRLGISDSMVEKHIEKGMRITIKYMTESGQFEHTESETKGGGPKEASKP